MVHPSDGPVIDDGVLRDPGRLRAVADLELLDTPDEDVFDRWGHRASQLTGATSALVSLVDDSRSFFKSFQLGDGAAGDGRTVPICDSLCREVVVRGDPLITGDASTDPRTRDYAAVRAFPVGAYAGMPLRSAEGHVLGSFCVVDDEAREWTPDQVAALADLSAAVESELRLRAAVHHNRSQAALVDSHHRVHALMLSGTPRVNVLADVVAGIGHLVDGMTGLLTLTEDLVEDSTASPCVDAARTGTNVIATDLASDGRWPQLPSTGMGSCWAVPIIGSDGVSRGAIALWGAAPRTPFAQDLVSLDQAARLAAIVLERDEASRELIRISTLDALTGLPNRAWLVARLRERLRDAPDGRLLAVLFCDLNGFKKINDTLGHQMGDTILAEVGRRLSDEVREDDLVARLGGDEFVVVFGSRHDAATARVGAERLERALAAPFVAPDGQTLSVHAAIGIALVADTSPEEALRRADTAMYAAKHSDSQVSVYAGEIG